MELILILLILTIMFLLMVLILPPNYRSYFSAYPSDHFNIGAQTDACASHCFKIGGRVADDNDCCDCQATEYTGGVIIGKEGNYEKLFRRCMCNRGHPNHCFKESTNLLLSQ